MKITKDVIIGCAPVLPNELIYSFGYLFTFWFSNLPRHSSFSHCFLLLRHKSLVARQCDPMFLSETYFLLTIPCLQGQNFLSLEG